MPGGHFRPPADASPASTCRGGRELCARPINIRCSSIQSAPAATSGWARDQGQRRVRSWSIWAGAINRILDIDEKLAFAHQLSPGWGTRCSMTSWSGAGQLADAGRMFQPTPRRGGRRRARQGAGYSPYFDHFGFSCGLEIVLGNGDVLRTGDGSIESEDLVNWHTSKYSFGPILDGLFAQSNYGIVTRMGLWLMPRRGGTLVSLRVPR